MSEPSPESSTPKVAEPDYGAYRIRRRKRWQPLRRWLEFALARTVLGVTRWLPIAALQALGRALGTLAYRLAAKQRGICRYQMALALPTLAELEREALIQSCFRHFGMTACEALGQRRLRQEGERWVRLEGEHVLRSAHAQGKGVMLVTAHTGNWELLPIAMDRLRLPTTVVVRPLHNPRLNAVMRDLRQSPNLELAERGTQSSPRQLLGALRQGRVLVMAADNDIDAQGVFVDFFGMPAFTPRAPAHLALKYEAPVVTFFDVRHPDGVHTFHFAEVAVTPAIRQAPDPVLALTQALARATEAHIRRYPDQWAWNHKRWRRRPVEAPGP